MKVAVVGVTGLVGTVMLKVLEERNFPVSQLIPVASDRSVGKSIEFKGQAHRIMSMNDAISQKPDIALFSAGGSTSLKFAPEFAKIGCCVIDNSSAWRMDEGVGLVVPEVNGDLLHGDEKIIANPNCSTIQLVTALNRIHQQYRIKRLVISTYQSPSGTGQKAIKQYFDEKDGKNVLDEDRAYPHPIYQNCLPHCDVFLDNGYTKEEMKLVNETRKILGDDNIAVTATAVRVPVLGGHSESVNVELVNEFELQDVISLFENTEGVVVEDNTDKNEYPTPLACHDMDEVKVGRIRMDLTQPNTFNCWIVADNLRKGAATNAVQIAEKMMAIWKKNPVATN